MFAIFPVVQSFLLDRADSFLFEPYSFMVLIYVCKCGIC